jgi:hypothetical protein
MFIRGIGSPDFANPFLDLAGNGVRSLQQILAFDDELPISFNTVLHRISWSLHETPPETNWDSTGQTSSQELQLSCPRMQLSNAERGEALGGWDRD